MPNFQKSEKELTARLDKWLYFIKHLEDFQTIPAIFKDEVFTQAFEKAELANLKPAEMDSYEASLKVFRDLKNTYDYAVQTARNEGLELGMEEGRAKGLEEGKIEGKVEGKIEGLLEGKLEIARKMKAKGLSTKDIADLTGLPDDEIEKL